MSDIEQLDCRYILQWSDIKPTGTEWLIERHIEKGSLGTIIGQPASGKSFFALDLAASVASGRDWNGNRVKQGSVLYIAGEGSSGLLRRMRALQMEGRINPSDPFFLVTSPYSPFVEEQASQMIQELNELVHGPSLIIVDTLASVFYGMDENKSADMTRFLQELRGLANIHNSALMIVHHSLRDASRARGSSVLLGAVDYEIFLKPQGGITEVAFQKVKDSETPAPFLFALRPIDLKMQDNFGNAVSSAVVDYNVSAELRHEGGNMELRKFAQTVLEVIESLQAHGTVNADRVRNKAETLSVRGKGYESALGDLISAGLIEFEGMDIRRIYAKKAR